MENSNLFTNKYQVSKTLRFRLEPTGGTDDLLRQAQIIEGDERRNKEAITMKQILDNCHKQIIERVLSDFNFKEHSLEEFFKVYTRNDDDREKDIENLQSKMRKEIADAFTKQDVTKLFSSKFKDFVERGLIKYASNEKERNIVSRFKGFATYFTGFNTNRLNMYSEEAKSTAISFRLINQNLIKFIDNILVYKKVSQTLPSDMLSNIYIDFKAIINTSSLEEFFSINNYNNILTQKQIEIFNAVIGGKKDKDEKIITKGFNQYINEYNQTNKNIRLPKMMRLFNQILSDREGVSARPEPFNNANETINSVRDCFTNEISKQITILSETTSKIESFDIDRIYIKGGEDLRALSNSIYGYFNYIHDRIADKWKHNNPQGKKSPESYQKNLNAYLKGIKSVSLHSIANICGDNKVIEYFRNLGAENTVDFQRENVVSLIDNKYNCASNLLSDAQITDEELRTNSRSIKDLLDAVKSAQRFFRLLCGSGNEPDKDHSFYDEYTPAFEALENSINPLYNKVRSFVTKKDFSTDKFKLNFDSSSFLSGWAKKSEYEKSSAFIFIRDNQYYLGINKCLSKEDIAYLEDSTSSSDTKRVVYMFQKVDATNIPRIFIRSKGSNLAPAVNEFQLPIETILDIYDNKFFTTSYQKKDRTKWKESLTKLIDYYKLGFSQHKSYADFDLKWKASSEYNDINDFLADVQRFCYRIEFININWDKLIEFTEDGKFYLFRIANKDLSGNSTGLPNLHTIYWKMLFDESNLKDIVYKLSGNAEVFMRYNSLKNPIVHKAGVEIKNKCPFTEKKTSIFDYDIIKDRRYTKDQLELHVPILMNFKSPSAAKGKAFNKECLEYIRNNGIKHIIGIDRGERNLLYMVITDLDGNIVEQKSLNQIASNPKLPLFRQDYNKLLKTKADANAQARRDWETIDTVKEIKFGFLSQIVHEIAMAIIKYDAIVVLENLNRGFMQKRGLENNVYQKFEQMLLDKLSYYVDKTKQPEEPGGALHAYQLSDTYANFNSLSKNAMVRQSGFVFYIPAWLTSKIDPVTGFASFLKFHRDDSMATIKSTISKFDCFKYDKECDMFHIRIDYNKFSTSCSGGQRKWDLFTFGDRILAERNTMQNSRYVYQTVNLTSEFKNLFATKDIDFSGNLKDSICKIEDVGFFRKLSQLLSLTLQLRNSNAETGEDFLISPVADKDGNFFDSRNCPDSLPKDADANGAYNIARKGLMLVEQLKRCEDVSKFKPAIKNEDWLDYVQR